MAIKARSKKVFIQALDICRFLPENQAINELMRVFPKINETEAKEYISLAMVLASDANQVVEIIKEKYPLEIDGNQLGAGYIDPHREESEGFIPLLNWRSENDNVSNE